MERKFDIFTFLIGAIVTTIAFLTRICDIGLLILIILIMTFFGRKLHEFTEHSVY